MTTRARLKPVLVSLGVDIPDDGLSLREFVRQRLRCPLEVVLSDSDDGLTFELQELWKVIVGNHEVDTESEYLSTYFGDEDGLSLDLYEAIEDDPKLWRSELRANAHNINGWYNTARNEFVDQTKLFAAPVAGPAEYPKHFPLSSCRTFADLQRRSMASNGGRSASQLLYGIEQAELEEFVTSIEAECFDQLKGNQSFRTAIDCRGEIGVVEDVLTHYVAAEWNPAIVHVYPITEREALAICPDGEVLTSDLLQEYGRKNRD